MKGKKQKKSEKLSSTANLHRLGDWDRSSPKHRWSLHLI